MAYNKLYLFVDTSYSKYRINTKYTSTGFKLVTLYYHKLNKPHTTPVILTFQISNSTVVCSKHFDKCDYKWTPTGKKLLKPNIVPHEFNWPQVEVSLRKRKSPRKRLFNPDTNEDSCNR